MSFLGHQLQESHEWAEAEVEADVQSEKRLGKTERVLEVYHNVQLGVTRRIFGSFPSKINLNPTEKGTSELTSSLSRQL
jgi:hypothetical protein